MKEINKLSNEEKYLKLLSLKVSPSKASDYYFAYKEIEEYCLKKKIIDNPLLEITDVKTVLKVKETVERSRVFRFFHRKNKNRLIDAIGCFYKYTKAEQESFYEKQYKLQERVISENTAVNRVKPETVTERNKNIEELERIKSTSGICSKKETEWEEKVAREVAYRSVVAAKNEDNITVYEHGNKFSTVKDIHEEKNLSSEKSEEPKMEVVDFGNLTSYAYTKPIKYTYFEKPFNNFNSWKGMYVSLVNLLLENYDWIIEGLKGKSINSKNGRIDIGDLHYQGNMLSPKTLLNGVYLETNLSAYDITVKIKGLFDLCNIDYENLIIYYKEKESNRKSGTNEVLTKKREAYTQNKDKKGYIDKGESFYLWLKNEKGLAETICKNYYYSISNIDDFSRERNLFSESIYDLDSYQEVYNKTKILLQNYEFVKMNESQHNRLMATLNNYMQFIDNSSYIIEIMSDINNLYEESNEELKLYNDILVKNYPRGFRYNSPIDMRKFRVYWEKTYGEELDGSDEEIYDNIDEITIAYQRGNQTFALIPEKLLSEEHETELFSYIDKSFLKGKKAIYYKALYEELPTVLCESGINNPDMLKTYLSYVNEGQYYVDRSYLTQERGIKIDPLYEIRNYLVRIGMPVKTDELCDELSHIPRKKVELILHTHSEFIRNAKSEYFHLDTVEISEDELEGISDLINQEIEENYFMSENELTDAVKKKYPQVFERQTQFSKLGMRDTIGYKLKDKYSFKGKIISEKGKGLSMSDVYERFCQKRHSFTLKDLKALKKALNSGVIYFDAVYGNALRISKNDFASKKLANFDIKGTDEAIDRFCEGDYIPINDIEHFGSFPDAGFPWNSYLMEHYVAEYSKKYKLLHTNFNESSCVGAIVKNIADIEDFYVLIVDVIVNSNIVLDSDTALDYLCDHGFLGRRSYKDIDKAIVQAKAIREKRG